MPCVWLRLSACAGAAQKKNMARGARASPAPHPQCSLLTRPPPALPHSCQALKQLWRDGQTLLLDLGEDLSNVVMECRM